MDVSFLLLEEVMEKTNSNLGKIFSIASNVPLFVAALMLILQLVTACNYGIQGDELYFIACSEHLDFGYVDHPPLAALLTLISRIFFGSSLLALKIFPALAGAATVLLAAAIARNLGGSQFAQGLAALTVLVSSGLIAVFNIMTMNAFDILLVTLSAHLLVKVINKSSAKNWILFGLVVGIGLQNKLTLLFFAFATVVGLLLTRHRRLLLSPWPYLAGLMAVLIFLPNIIWQVQNNWPTLEFMTGAKPSRIYPGSPFDYMMQLTLALNPMLLPVWIAGLFSLFFSKDLTKYRILGILSVTVLAIFLTNRSHIYYMFPIMPLLFAAGAVAIDRLIKRLSWKWVRTAFVSLLIVFGGFIAPLAVPILPVEKFISYSNTIGLFKKVEMYERVQLPIHFGFRFGWKEMVTTVAQVYNSLPESEKAGCAILTSNYAKAAAVDYFGSNQELPTAISGHNNYWIWGPRDHTGEVIISIGFGEEFLSQIFQSVELAAVINHPYAMAWETNQPVFICRKPVSPLKELWPMFKRYS